MADFIEVTEIVQSKQDYKEYDGKTWISKFHLTRIDPDERHSQTFLIYDGKEMKVRETVNELIAKFAE